MSKIPSFETRIVMALAFESRRMTRAAKKVKALVKVLESRHGVAVPKEQSASPTRQR
jgi:hypothetical protein